MLAAFVIRDLCRAAVRLCTMPLEAALSNARAASSARSVAAAASPSATALLTFFVAVFSAERTALFRSCAFSF